MQRLILNTIVSRGASTFLNFLIALLIARHCGPMVKGQVTLLITTVWFCIFFSNILGGQALVYLLPRNKAELLVIPAYVWSAIISVLAFVILKYAHVVKAAHVPSIAVLSLFSAVVSIHQTILLARRQITHANLIQVLLLMGQLAGVLFCFYFLKINDAYAFIYSALGAYFFTAFISFFFIRHLINFSEFRRDFALPDMKVSFRYGLLYQLSEVLQLFNLRYYFYPLALLEGTRYLGVYSIGISILEAVWIIPRSISTVHYVATATSTGARDKAIQTAQLVKWSFLLCGLALAFIWLIPSSAYTLVFGPGFADVKHSMRFLIPGILIYSTPLVISSYYMGIGKYRALMASHAAGFVVLIGLSWFLIPRYVMSGAGLAATLSFTFAAIVMLAYFKKDNQLPVGAFLPTATDVQQMRVYIAGKLKR